ncbi:MAG: alpha-amylase family glycosyl hydrolase [Crocinitomicaceae bacterium]
MKNVFIKIGVIALLSANQSFAQDTQPTSVISAPKWTKNATIYEVNIRQYTPEGTFKAFEAHLPRLQKMGVDILWLMPVNPIGELNRKGGLGSYYAVKDYKAVNPKFGTDDDFQSLINAAHALGIKVIIDWVANHSSPDNRWIEEGHLDWYTLDSLGHVQPTIGTDWYDVADLNYDSKEMRTEMISSMKYWVTKFDIDGFRCDVADWVPVDFWNDARKELDQVKPVFMLAEAENPQHHVAAFDMSYGWNFHHIMNEVAKGKMNAADIKKYLILDELQFPSNAMRMQFTSNHDENSWNGTEMERMGTALEALAALTYCVDGMPLIYSGQETSLSKRLLFFEKDTILWDKMDKVDFYTKMNRLKAENKALENGANAGETEFINELCTNQVLVFQRKKGCNTVTCVFNLSPNAQTLSGNLPKKSGKVFISNDATGSNTLAPWSYRIYTK